MKARFTSFRNILVSPETEEENLILEEWTNQCANGEAERRIGCGIESKNSKLTYSFNVTLVQKSESV